MNVPTSTHPNRNQQQFPEEAEGQSCDRRRSRAARSVLMGKTIPILKGYYKYAIPEHESVHDQMITYKVFITDLMTNSKTCVLNPKRDQFWKDELHYATVRSKNNRLNIPTLHKCGSCGKTFMSRYYLDSHNEKFHGKDEFHKSDEICPAKELCNLPGGTLCDREALKNEPFYAEGIHSKNDPESQNVYLKYQRELNAHPCNQAELDESRRNCIESINHCFVGMDNLIEDMTNALCETQTCHHHLYSLHSAMDSFHSLKEEWDWHHDEMHELGYSLVFIIFIALLWAIWRWGYLIFLFEKRPQREFDMNKRKKL